MAADAFEDDRAAADAATAPDGGVADPIQSLSASFGGGARIQVDVIRSAGGPEVVTGFYDALRDEPCSFEVASDGQLRCVPSAVGSMSGLVFFSDATCVQPVHIEGNRELCTSLGAVRMSVQDGCAWRTRVYALMEELPLNTPLYTQDDQGTCTPSSLSGLRIFPVGAEIAADEFAAASVVEWARTEALVIEVLATEDGARAFRRIALSSGETCSPAKATDDQPHCLPSGGVLSGYYGDASCTAPLAAASVAAECELPAYASWQEPGCDAPRGVRQVTGAFEGTAYRVASAGGSCQAATSYDPLFAVGDPIDPSFFPATPEELGPGERLRERRHRLSEGAAARISLYDTELGADCSFVPDRNGDLRCMPLTQGTVIADVYFLDVSCAIPLISDANPCPNLFASQKLDGQSCEAQRYDVYRVGAPHTGNVYFKTGTFCTRATAPGEFGLSFFRRGDWVAPEDLVLGTASRGR